MATTTVFPTPTLKPADPTPTQWLPYNPDASDEGCAYFIPTAISVEETAGWLPESIAQKLVELYLEYFLSPERGGICRLEDFKVTELAPGELTVTLSEDQLPEYTGTVDFAVKVKEMPTVWITLNGDLAPDGWIVRKMLNISIKILEDQYVLNFRASG